MQATTLAALVLALFAAAPRAAAQDAPLVRVGEPVRGELSSGDAVASDGSYQDAYTFSASTGDRVAISLSAEFDAYLWVGRQTGGEFESLASNDDGGEGTDALVLLRVPQTGSYRIHANSLGAGETGQYTLELRSLPPALVGPPTRVQVGETRRGRLELTDPLMQDGSFYDEFVFHGDPGDRVQIDLETAAFDAYLGVGRGTGDGYTVIDSDDDGGEGTDSRLVFTIPDDGDFVIRANSLYGAGMGDYTIRLTSLGAAPVEEQPVEEPPVAVQGLVVLAGETRVGQLEEDDATLENDGSYYDGYLYDGRQGETITITLRSADFDTYLSIGRLANGVFQGLGSDDDGAGGTDSQLQVTLPETGRYLIRANSLYPATTGGYTLQVESDR